MSTTFHRTDGRNARAERTRDAVANALLALFQDGHLRPTSSEIADRAGVSLRSVFQHFDDMETLIATVSEVQMERLSRYISQDEGAGPLAPRLSSFIERRAAALETITPVRRAAVLQEPFSDVLSRRLRTAHDIALAEVERTFRPELAAVPPGDREELLCALDVASNWSAWDALRRITGLSEEQSRRVMERTIIALLRQPETIAERRAPQVAHDANP